jgi:hypothetical protein
MIEEEPSARERPDYLPRSADPRSMDRNPQPQQREVRAEHHVLLASARVSGRMSIAGPSRPELAARVVLVRERFQSLR